MVFVSMVIRIAGGLFAMSSLRPAFAGSDLDIEPVDDRAFFSSSSEQREARPTKYHGRIRTTLASLGRWASSARSSLRSVALQIPSARS